MPQLGLPAFYDSLLYLMLHWIVLATSWNILSGYTGYFSFGHGAFFGAGLYTTTTLLARYEWPFLWTLPVAAAVAALLGVTLGAIVFRVKGVRGELFALLTLAITFVIGTIVVNTPLDGGSGVSLSGVPVPKIGPRASSTFFLLALAAATATLLIAWWIAVSRFGAGLFAIHDDEDAAEVLGVPTYRYKLYALAISCALAGVAGGIHALFLSYVTVGEVFTITVPLTVVLMSVLGGTRHWAGPAIGAIAITALLYAFTAADHAVAGKAASGAILIAAILFMPDGILPRLQRLFRRGGAAAAPATAALAGGRGLRGARPAPAPVADAKVRPRVPAPPARRCCACAACTRRSAASRRSPASTSTCAAARSSACSGRTARASRPSSTSSAATTRRPPGRSPSRAGSSSAAPAHRIAGAGIARTYQIPRPVRPPDACSTTSPWRRCSAAACATPTRRARQAMQWLAFAGLEGKAAARPEDLNLHQRKFLELARALASRPRLVLLDEVLCGLTPSEIDDAVALIRRIRDQGSTIVFVEHVMRAVMALTDRVVVLNHGELLAEGPAAEVMQRPEVMTAYLGPAHA